MSKDHYVPEFYLKNWANSQGLVGSYQYIDAIEEFKWSRKAPAAFCYQKNLYGDSEENYFKPLDDDAAKLISKFKKVENKKPVEVKLTKTEHTKWSHFLLSMILRTPKTVEKIANAFEIHGLGKFDSVAQIPAIINDGEAIKDLRSMKWVFAEVPSRFELITSDNPLVFSLSKPLNSSSKIILPVSPTHCFVACRDDAGRELPPDPDSLAKYVNSEIIKNCDKRIFSKSEIPLNYVQKHWTKS